MNKKDMTRWWGSSIAALVLLSACGGSGTARLQFQNTTGATMAAKTAAQNFDLRAMTGNLEASHFEMKLIAAYLAEDVDPSTQNNIGNTSMFWLNSECNEDISNCNASNLTTFFNFTDPTATNAALNSQGREIDTGTYKYVRLEFCKYGAGGPNVGWKYNSGASTHTFESGMCGVTSTVIDPPLQVNDGDSVTITLSYSLANTVWQYGGGGTLPSYCANESGTDYCFEVPTFTPTATK